MAMSSSVSLSQFLWEKKKKRERPRARRSDDAKKRGHGGQPGLMHLSQEPVSQGGGHGGEACCSLQRPGVEERGMGRPLKWGQANCRQAAFPGGRKAGGASRGRGQMIIMKIISGVLCGCHIIKITWLVGQWMGLLTSPRENEGGLAGPPQSLTATSPSLL